MSLSTLLEAAKYLDYLDSNNQQPVQQHQQSQISAKKPARRQRSSKKDAANTMVAMSLPTSRPMQMQGVPIPHSSGASHQTASLSSSFATESPLSSFASTALLCSKASEVASASSSAASSLSSSDSSSSCGEILMGDNDFNQSPPPQKVGGSSSSSSSASRAKSAKRSYNKTHRKVESVHQFPGHHQYIASSPNNQSIARYIAATSAGPQLVTMTSSYAMTSASAPVDGHIRAGHVIHAANTGAILSATNTSIGGTNFEPKYFSTITDGNILQQTGRGYEGGHAFSLNATSFGSEDQLSGSAPSSCPPLIMARVQPMILNSMSPCTQNIMALQPATASSPTSSSSSYSRHRELHKTLEKNRRAHLRHCFEILKAELPSSECADKKTSHINIIKSAIRYVLALREQECEIENELQRLTKIKSELTENLSKMRSMQQSSEKQVQQQIYSSAPDESPQQQQQRESREEPSITNSLAQQQPVAEQQLSFLLSQSKLD